MNVVEYHPATAITMLEKQYILKHLAKTYCYKCGASMEGAELTTVSEVPVALIAHAKCPNCKAESMITITVAGTGASPLISDLKAHEIKKFMGEKSISYDEILAVHKQMQKTSVCKLMQNLEKKQAKAQKALDKTDSFQQ